MAACIDGWYACFVCGLRLRSSLSIAGITAAMVAVQLEKNSVAFLYCYNHMNSVNNWLQRILLTSRTATRSTTILQSSLSNSYLRSFKVLSAVIASTGRRYLRAKAIMSYVEFHLVTTSRGMTLGLSPLSRQCLRQ